MYYLLYINVTYDESDNLCFNVFVFSFTNPFNGCVSLFRCEYSTDTALLTWSTTNANPRTIVTIPQWNSRYRKSTITTKRRKLNTNRLRPFLTEGVGYVGELDHPRNAFSTTILIHLAT